MVYICTNCDYGAASWMGRCPNCSEWNTLVQKSEQTVGSRESEILQLTSLRTVKTSKKERKKTGIFELDRVLGTGFTPGEVILLTGEPGIGKSTLLLQSLKYLKTIYISGEESAEQVKDRAERLDLPLDEFLFSNTLQVEGIINGLENQKKTFDVLVIDSIQTAYSQTIESPPGSVSQLKESTNKLIAYAKKNKIILILVGHITKEGDAAGPKTLEHLVDCVLSFEGEKISNFRILRASKNRFGSTDEIGIFQMVGNGLKEVSNPMVFLEHEAESVPGRAVAGINEGKRPLFFEIQTLAVSTSFAMPRRVVKGVDYNKVLLLLAVVRKHLGIPLDTYDIYVNVVGGVSIKSPTADLAIIASLLSSLKNIALPKHTVFLGEVGLLGEVRKGYEEKIIAEAKRLQFASIYSSKNLKNIKQLKALFISS